MNKLIVTVILALTALPASVLADDVAGNEKRAKYSERRERYLRSTGGRIVQPGTPLGKIRFVTSVGDDTVVELPKQYEAFKKVHPFDIETVRGPSVSVETAAAEKARLGFALAVFIVDAPFSAPMLTAPEEGWAIVNHRVCETPQRTAKQAVKAFAIIAGAANSSHGISFLSSTRPRELDSIATVEFPIDVSECIVKQLALVNVKPKRVVIYRQACMEGWAPAPTNAYQKAAWDKVHAVPKKPITIEPERGREGQTPVTRIE